MKVYISLIEEPEGYKKESDFFKWGKKVEKEILSLLDVDCTFADELYIKDLD